MKEDLTSWDKSSTSNCWQLEFSRYFSGTSSQLCCNSLFASGTTYRDFSSQAGLSYGHSQCISMHRSGFLMYNQSIYQSNIQFTRSKSVFLWTGMTGPKLSLGGMAGRLSIFPPSYPSVSKKARCKSSRQRGQRRPQRSHRSKQSWGDGWVLTSTRLKF